MNTHVVCPAQSLEPLRAGRALAVPSQEEIGTGRDRSQDWGGFCRFDPDFWNALSDELTEKGSYSQVGWAKDGNDVGVGTISLKGLGTFEYDPTLADEGKAKYCYAFDPSKLRLRPMEGEENKLMTPERPYDYFVFIKSMTWTGGLECIQLNTCGVYSIA